jgi:phosphotransferase system  glucose/maltose/N-acetylglucosamine-specific IIC component
MKLSIKSMALALGIFWAAAVFLVGLAHLIWPGYGGALLALVASLYPGYDADAGFFSLIVGTVYAFVDGAICGAVVAWLYNRFSA